MPTKRHLATISIMVKDRQMHAKEVQEILTNHGHTIIARLGVNPQRACIEHCTGVIVIVVEGSSKDINALTKDLDKLYGIVAKKTILTD